MDALNNDNNDRKKQKAGLNAVRPDEYVETTFKQMAKDSNLSQTEFFTRIFWSYMSQENDALKKSALDIESEIDLISNDLGNMLKHFKSISNKAQNTILSLKNNAEQTEKNFSLDIDTLNKKLEELEKRNKELEQSNSAFSEIKTGLENKIIDLIASIKKNSDELKDSHQLINDKDKEIKELMNSNKVQDKNLSSLESINGKLEKEVQVLQDELNTKNIKINNLEQSYSSLNDTISKLESLKKSEVSAIESKYMLHISELENKLNTYNDEKKKEIERIKTNLEIQYEADKKMALADMKLELANATNKYAELLSKSSNNLNK